MSGGIQATTLAHARFVHCVVKRPEDAKRINYTLMQVKQGHYAKAVITIAISVKMGMNDGRFRDRRFNV
jgi:hypothetical protein